MTKYIISRLILMIPTLFGGLAVVFVLFRVVPGDPVLMMMGGGGDAGSVNPEAYAALKHQLRLDEPIAVQFALWLQDAAVGDFGTSFQTSHPVTDEIGRRAPTTLALAALALGITIVFSIPMGIIAALKQDTVVDYGLRILAVSALSMPTFWIGILTVLALIRFWGWFPPISYASPYSEPWIAMQQLFLPALVLGLRSVGVSMRVLRSSLLEEIRSDYARTGYAKGLSRRAVVWKHVMPNAFLPTLTLFSLEAAFLIGGSVIVETIFNVNGLGALAIDALTNRDFPVVQGILVVVLVSVMLINLTVDLLYARIDPRIRYSA